MPNDVITNPPTSWKELIEYCYLNRDCIYVRIEASDIALEDVSAEKVLENLLIWGNQRILALTDAPINAPDENK